MVLNKKIYHTFMEDNQINKSVDDRRLRSIQIRRFCARRKAKKFGDLATLIAIHQDSFTSDI